MMNVIYVDELVFFNTVITFILLLSTAQIVGTVPGVSRIITASFVGGIYSLIILAPPMHWILIIITRIAMAVTMICIAFNKKKLKTFLKLTIVFFAISFLFFGIIFSLYYLSGSDYFMINNGSAYLNISAVSMTILSGVLYLIIYVTRKILFKRRKTDNIVPVKLQLNDIIIEEKAFIDTGNELRDIFTNKSVIVIDRETAFKLTGDIITTDKITEDNAYMLRLLPVKTVSGEKLMPAFTLDNIIVLSEINTKKTEKPTAIVCENCMNNEKYSVLINEEFV